MNFSEFVGFVITVGAMLFIVGRSIWDQYQANKNPQKEEPSQPEVLRDFLKSLDVDLESEAPLKPKPIPKMKQGPKKKQAKVPPAPKPQMAVLKAPLTPDHLDAYSLLKQGPGVARGRKVLDSLNSRRDMFIVQTIINPPKGFSR